MSNYIKDESLIEGTDPFGDVYEFMQLGKQLTFETDGFPVEVKHPLRILRRRLLADRDEGELGEYLDGEFNNDLQEIVDGLADIIVVAVGTLISYVGRRTALKILWEVGQSNLAKVDGRFGPIIRDAGGKIKKPKGWLPPDIASILDENPKLNGWRKWRGAGSFTMEEKK